MRDAPKPHKTLTPGRVPKVRLGVPGPKKMGEAQRSLFLNWPQTPLTPISIPRC
jgi:hypothetical protein